MTPELKLHSAVMQQCARTQAKIDEAREALETDTELEDYERLLLQYRVTAEEDIRRHLDELAAFLLSIGEVELNSRHEGFVHCLITSKLNEYRDLTIKAEVEAVSIKAAHDAYEALGEHWRHRCWEAQSKLSEAKKAAVTARRELNEWVAVRDYAQEHWVKFGIVYKHLPELP